MEYIKYKDNNQQIITSNVPLKKEDIYYLTNEEDYWLVASGKDKDLQNPFISKGIIGIAWDNITLEDIKNNSEDQLKKILKDRYSNIKQNYDEERAFKSYISQTTHKLKIFVDDMKLGDIIVLKDRGSRKIYFGKIISEAEDYQERDLYIDDTTGYCNKIRKVKWLKSVNKDLVGSELKLAFTSRHAISKIKKNKVKDEVNREIFSYFYRGENLHIIFNVKINNDIPQDDFKLFQDYIHKLKTECINSTGTENIFNIKTNVQSPGPIEFFGNPEIIKHIFQAITGIGVVSTTYLKIKQKLDIKDPQKNDEEIDDGFSRGN